MQPLIVLKFGGSVLRSGATLELAVHEIARWRRQGSGVVAVVSALAGRTNELFAECRARGRSEPHDVAGHVAAGERESARLLGERLLAAGVPARVLQGALPRCAGGALDASPESSESSDALDAAPVRAVLAAGEVAVVPGFVGQDARARTVLLGRGGSDLSAIVLARALGARCRLVKDVDGLYERDPADTSAAPPRRYAEASWDDALDTDGTIVQHKAVRLARQWRVAFELGALGSDAPTRIGRGPRRWSRPVAKVPPLRVALLGHGTVGRGVAERLLQLGERLQLQVLSVADAARERAVPLPAGVPLAEAATAAASGVDVIVEAIGGTETARVAVLAAFAAGAHVVTANKALVAAHGPELRAAALRAGRTLRCAAAVGGSTPIVDRLLRAGTRRLAHLRGVLNATANVVLDAVAAGRSLSDAVAQAQRDGLAERDPARDLDGRDAADKLAVLAQCAGAPALPAAAVARTPIDAGTLARGPGEGRRWRQVASLWRDGEALRGRVELLAVGAGDPLFALGGDWNGVELWWTDGEREWLRGRGAGSRPTAEAVIGDLLAVHAAVRAAPPPGGVEDPERQEVCDVVAP